MTEELWVGKLNERTTAQAAFTGLGLHVTTFSLLIILLWTLIFYMVVISFFVPLLQDDCMCTLLLLFAWCAMLITLLPIVFFLYQLKQVCYWNYCMMVWSRG